MASGLVHYAITAADVSAIISIGMGRRARLLPAAAGEEYAALVTRSPVPDAPGDATHADLLVFVDGTQPYFVRNAVQGTGQPGTFNATPQKGQVG